MIARQQLAAAIASGAGRGRRSALGFASAGLARALVLLVAASASFASSSRDSAPARDAAAPTTAAAQAPARDLAAPLAASAAAPAAAAGEGREGSPAVSTSAGARPAGRFTLSGISRRTLKNGLVAIVAERHSIPTVAVTVMIRAGAAQNPPSRAGAADVLAELLTLGTKTRSASKIAEEVDAMGATLSASSGYDSSTVSLTGLSADTSRILDLAADLVRNPAFPPSELAELKTRRSGALKRQIDSPQVLADRAFQRTLFGAHPYGQPADGTLKSLDALAAADLKSYYDTWYVPNDAVVAVAGDVTPDTVMPEIERLFGSWPKKALPAAAAAPADPVAGSGTRVVIVDKPDLTQGQIRIGRLGVKRATPDWYELQVANYLLGGGGFSSRLVKRIRSEKGLTYGVGSGFTPRRFTGPFTISTFTPNASVGETIDEALGVLAKLRAEGPGDQELADAKSFYVGGFPLALETPAQLAQQLLNVELYGLPADYLATYQSRFGSVGAEDVRRVLKTRFDPSSLVIVVVTKAADVKESLAKYGQVEVIPFASME